MENSNSLFEHFSFTVDRGQSPLRIDKYLMNFVENATRTKIQAAAKLGSIQVDGNVVKSNYKVKPGDKIKVLFEYPPHENLLLPENIDLDIGKQAEDKTAAMGARYLTYWDPEYPEMLKMIYSKIISNVINAPDEKGQTQLHIIKDSGLVKMILELGGDVDYQDDLGQSPLFVHTDLEIIDVLIKKNADINLKDNNSFKR